MTPLVLRMTTAAATAAIVLALLLALIEPVSGADLLIAICVSFVVASLAATLVARRSE